MNDRLTPGFGAWRKLQEALGNPAQHEQRMEEALRAAAARQQAPVLWLLGTTQSGKTSVVRALTGSPRAEIGNGFQPCTRNAQIYEFPAGAPLVRFLDTRGLGEVDYDPAEDIALCEQQAQLVIAVIKVTDTRPEAVLRVLRAVRKRHPEWPIVVAQTCLHEAYPEADSEHVMPYPFQAADWTQRVPTNLARLLQAQNACLDELPGSAAMYRVPVDLTQPEDGLLPEDYGADALWAAIEEASSLGLQARLRADPAVSDAYARSTHPQIVAYSLAAGAVGALPLVDMALVPALQAKLLHSLAAIYKVSWSRRTSAEFFGLLGGSFVLGYGLRMAGRSLVKLIPGWGQSAGAAWGATASAAITFALGKSACAYLARRSEGLPMAAEDLREVYRAALGHGRELLVRKPGEPSS